jgi:uncharacterized protein (DUF2249 family)
VPDLAVEENAAASPAAPSSGRPHWVNEADVRYTLDADQLIAACEHPLGKVRAHVAKLAAGELVRLTSSFYPAPLIDALSRPGLSVYSTKVAPRRHETYIGLPAVL